MTQRRELVRIVAAVGISFYLGVLRLFESPNRYRSPGYDAAKAAMPIKAWGGLFLAIGVMLLICWCLHSTTLLRIPAAVGAAVFLLWGSLSAISAYHTGETSFSGAGLYTLAAMPFGALFVKGY